MAEPKAGKRPKPFSVLSFRQAMRLLFPADVRHPRMPYIPGGYGIPKKIIEPTF